MNNEEIRPSTNLVISKCGAYDYLNNVRPNLEKLTVQYYDTFSITNKFTGYFPNVTIGDFFNDLSSDSCGGIAILGGLNATSRENLKNDSSSDSNGSSSGSSDSSSSSDDSNNSEQSNEKEPQNVTTNSEQLSAGSSSVEGKRGSENIGIAIFNDDKLCGELTATETVCHLLIQNDLDYCIISVDNPINNSGKIELRLHPNKKSKINVTIKDNIPHISVVLSVDVDILTLEDDIDYESSEVLEKFSDSTKQYLKKQFENYFNKLSKEYKTDIDQFCQKALPHFSTISEWKNFNWSEKLTKAEFNVNINVDTVTSLLITKT